jgi:hypothetical protein
VTVALALPPDAAAGNRGAVAGDAATLQVLWDRTGHAVDRAADHRRPAHHPRRRWHAGYQGGSPPWSPPC